jgi:hypothetical protein
MAKNAIDHGVRRCHTAAMGPRARQQSTQQSTYIICDRAASVNLEKILIITINMTIIARRVVDDRGSGGKNVIFSNRPYDQSKYSDPLIYVPI